MSVSARRLKTGGTLNENTYRPSLHLRGEAHLQGSVEEA